MKAASELLEKERKRGVKEGIARALLLVLLGCALALLFGWLLCSGVWGKAVLAVIDPVTIPANHWIIDIEIAWWSTDQFSTKFIFLLWLCSLPPINTQMPNCAFSLLVWNSRQPQRSKVYLFLLVIWLLDDPYNFNTLPKQLNYQNSFVDANLDIQLLQVSASDSASPDAEKLAQEAKQQFSSLGDKTGEALATWIPIVTQWISKHEHLPKKVDDTRPTFQFRPWFPWPKCIFLSCLAWPWDQLICEQMFQVAGFESTFYSESWEL